MIEINRFRAGVTAPSRRARPNCCRLVSNELMPIFIEKDCSRIAPSSGWAGSGYGGAAPSRQHPTAGSLLYYTVIFVRAGQCDIYTMK